MKIHWMLFFAAAGWVLPLRLDAQLPPKRSSLYDGSASVQMRFPAAIYAPNLELTVEAWVYREDASRCETIVSQDFTKSFWFGFCDNTLRFYRNGGKFADAGVNVPAHRWTHVAAVYDSFAQHIRFYLDGKLAATKSSAATNAPLDLPLYLGMTPASFPLTSTYPFKGAVDEVRIWSRALSASELNPNRFKELSSGDGLVAVFPKGGFSETLGNRTATVTNGVVQQVFGVLPRGLIIPRRPLSDSPDGDITADEYTGAEEMVIRHLQGTNEVDVRAYLNGYVASVGGRDITYIYVGVPGSSWQSDLGRQGASFSWYFGIAEADHSFPDPSDYKMTAFFNDSTNRFLHGDGTGAFVPYSFPSGTITKAFCSGDVSPPCIEMRSAVTIGFPRVLMLDLLIPAKLPADVKRFVAPFDAVPTDPQTWAPFGMGSTIGAAETVRLNVAVRDIRFPGAAPEPLPGALVRLLNANSLDEIKTATSRSDGTVHFEATIRTNTPLLVELAAPGYWPRLGARGVAGTGVPPASTTAGSVRFAACTGCAFADIEFDTRFVPEGALMATGITPTTGHFKRTIIRELPLRELPPSQIFLGGSNLHASVKVFLTTCDRAVFNIVGGTPADATGCNANSFYEITVNEISADRRTLTATLDNPTAPNSASLRLLVQDTASRGGERRWQYVPGAISLGQPPFPLLHGFEFYNERDGTQFDEFSGVFQWNAYDCLIPPGFVISPVQTCPGCRIPNPLYSIYYALFTGWVEAMTGSCLGMTATSVLFARGELDTEAFDPGVHYANGFPHRDFDPDPLMDSNSPPKPQEHRFRVCDYSEPVNLWAHIHRNQAVQTTKQFLDWILSQMHGTGIGTDSYSINGNPGLTLERVRTSLGRSVLCFQNLGNVFESHATVPYAITEGKSLATNGFDLVDRPDSTIIHLYDPNWPGHTGRFLEVNRTINRYRYRFSNRSGSANNAEDFWSGSGLYIVPSTVWTQPRSMPGIDLIERGLTLFFFGSADGLYTDASGGQWGWEKGGVLHDTYLGGKAFAPMTARDPAANTTRSVLFFPPSNSPPASVQANVRGGKWLFHAAEGGTLCQLEVPNGADGDTDALKLSQRNDMLNGFRFSPQRRTTTFTPRLGLNLGTNPAVVFSWDGLAVGAGKSVEFAARRELSGVEFGNDGGETSSVTLHVLRGGADGLKTNLFGPFQIPSGATHLATLPRNDGSALRSELDLNRDGTPETVSFIVPSTGSPAPPPILEAQRNGDLVLIRWPVNGGAWTLEQTDSLDFAVWSNVAATPSLEGDRSVVTLPATGTRFLRLRAQF